jgi:hypothetical protein
MGYRGLLLNDPYKIDRMMGCVCGYLSFISLFAGCLFSKGGGVKEPVVKSGIRVFEIWAVFEI